MPEKAKTVTKNQPLQTFPMPKYNYQTPQTGSFVVEYREEKERQEDRQVQLHNVKFA